jgi:hypothetical protein
VSRRLTLPAVALVLLAGPAVPAPKLKDREPQYLHPTKVGARKVYLDGDVEKTFVVTRSEAKDGMVVVTLCEIVDGKEVEAQTIHVSEKGLFRASIGTNKLAEPQCLVKLPLTKDEEWTFDLGPTYRDSGTLKFVSREKVEVPAGTFDAIRIEQTSKTGTATFWFAENAGLVKSIYLGQERVLKSLSTGK